MDFILDENQIHLWCVSLEVQESELERLKKYLNKKEKFRSEKFYSREDQRRFVVSHAALQCLLKNYLDSEYPFVFTENEYGKPFLAKNSLQFNLSHSHELALIAFAKNTSLGIDVERIKENPNIPNIARRFFSVCEAEQLLSLPSAKQTDFFYRCWTQKEALIKALGLGFSESLEGLNQNTEWYIQELSVHSHYKAALAVKGRDWKWELRQWDRFSHVKTF
ncbi:MAG: 4'-phosphopantetheinyl transferase superfamily protein [Deltaproteobacteria bacterium]|nr:4'-phosphopantetheinyl transferase superfamily protein [Deltaproteobacteria bacterium]